MSKTLVWVEHEAGSLKDATLAVVTAAAKLGEVHLLVAGQNVGGVAEQAAKIAGVGKVHVADDASLTNALAENVAPVIVELMGHHACPARAAFRSTARPRYCASAAAS